MARQDATTDSPPVRLAIVGHVDHGKSTLIGRLLHDTGSLPESVLARVQEASRDADRPQLEFITDHLAEERREAKTIDTTQVFFQHAGRRYVIIDTPGHAAFVKNMFTGASRADAALVVVDVAEGVREQTLAHCNVLGLLGIGRVVPVINKLDRRGYSQAAFESTAESVRARLGELDVSTGEAVPLSALHGENVAAPPERMPWYDGPTLLDVLAAVSAPVEPTGRPLRFAVQGAYETNDALLYLGRVEAGTIRRGQDVRVLPAGDEDRVDAVRVWGGELDAAGAGRSVGIALAGGLEQARSAVVCDPADRPDVSETLTGRVFWMGDRPLQRGESVEARVTTQEVPAEVRAIRNAFHSGGPDAVRPQAGHLAYGEIGLVTLALDAPLVCEPFSRETGLGTFVIARSGNVVGAGTVPDPADDTA
ncbi:MAG: GTP-binding protein [Planctomycetota bacterium]